MYVSTSVYYYDRYSYFKKLIKYQIIRYRRLVEMNVRQKQVCKREAKEFRNISQFSIKPTCKCFFEIEEPDRSSSASGERGTWPYLLQAEANRC